MHKDVERLEKITDRFSKIGSGGKLKEADLNATVKVVLDYLELRISNKVKIHFTDAEDMLIKHNPSLIEWVIENITKNAVDAMEADTTFLEKVKEEDLPKELKGKSKEEQQKYIKEKAEERDKIQAEIGRLGVEREKYIQEEMKKRNETGKTDDFGSAVAKSLKEKAKSLGYE
jgi:signal transduction histidine kinase